MPISSLLILLAIRVSSFGIEDCDDKSCLTCRSGYTYKYITCLEYCPSGYVSTNTSCLQTFNLVLFDLEFFNFLNFTANSIQTFHHPTLLPFNDPQRLSPVPTKFQGFYFEKTSSLVSSSSWVLAPDFCLSIYYKHFGDGVVFSAFSGKSVYLEISVVDSKTIISLLVYSGEFSKKLIRYSTEKYWSFIYLTISQTKKRLTISTNSKVDTFDRTEFQMPEESMSYVIGSQTNSFKGFLYHFCLRNDNNCFLKTLAGPSCNLNNYIKQSCEDCDPSCPTWPPCVRKDCNVCYSSTCNKCEGFGSEHCLSCSNPSLDQCITAKNCLKGSGFKCEVCQSGYELTEGLCVKPYSSFLPLNIKLDKIEQFHGGVFQSGLNSLTYAPFNNPEEDDPYPLFKRGYFFEKDQMLLAKNVTLNYKFSIFLWVNAQNFTHVIQSNSFKMFYDGVTRIMLENNEEKKMFISNGNCNKGKWKLIGLIVDYSDGTTFIHSVCGENVVQRVAIKGYAFYNTETYLKISGIKTFYLYQIIILPFAEFLYAEEANICGTHIDSSCLLLHSNDTYYQGYLNIYDKCDDSCRFGCKRFGTCNQCKSIRCRTCQNFTDDCDIDPQYNPCFAGLVLSKDGKNCCSPRCDICYGYQPFFCVSCKPGFVLDGNLCRSECPTGYSRNGTHCIPPTDSIVLDLKFNEIKRSNQFYLGSKINKSPSTDPQLIKMRGFYFKNHSSIILPNLLISQKCSIFIWIKLEHPGTIMKKGNLTVDSLISMSYSSFDFIFSPVSLGVWSVFAFNMFESLGVYTVMLKGLNGLRSTRSANLVIFEDSNSSLVIGNGFEGFLWGLGLYSNDLDPVALNICSKEIKNNCVFDCNISSYFDGEKCKECSYPCTECDGARCFKCSEGHSLNQHSRCACNGKSEKCYSCEWPCAKCMSNKRKCVSCSPLFQLTKTNKCECMEGYHLNGTRCEINKILVENTKKINLPKTENDWYICDNTSFTSFSQKNASENIFSFLTPSSKIKLKKFLLGSADFCDYLLNRTMSLEDIQFLSEDASIFSSKPLFYYLFPNKITLDRFEKKGLLGRGSFGEVYLVSDKLTNVSYALKVIPKYRLTNKAKIKAIVIERKALGSIRSKYMINLKFAFQDRTCLYFVIDLKKGGDLRFHMVSNKNLSELQVKFILSGVFLGLNFMHSVNYIHQDIKPANVMFDEEGYTSLTDLGLTNFYKPNNYMENGGSPGFKAPEIAYKLNHSFVSDYFSVGVVLHELIFNRKPYASITADDYIRELRKKEVSITEVPKNWTFEAIDFCNKLLRHNPKTRLGIGGIGDVKNHPWFKGFLWDQVERRKMAPPFVPGNLQGDFKDYKFTTWLEEQFDYSMDLDEIDKNFEDFDFAYED